MSLNHRIRAAIYIAVFVFLTVDAVVLISVGWRVMTGECPLGETLSLILGNSRVHKNEAKLGSEIRLIKSEEDLDLLSTRSGDFWVVHGDTILPFLLAEQEADIYEPAGHEVHPGDIVLDCGANIGVFSKKALSRGAALVIAIEPAPQTLAALRRNLEPEIRSGRVMVYPKGVWDHDDELALTVHQGNEAANSVVLGPDESTGKSVQIRVPLTTIDKIVDELKLPHVDFIKMDIEGAEKNAIRGATQTIQKFQPRMSLSSEHLADDHTAIPALVKSISPTYRYRGCDCDREFLRVSSKVLVFDSAP
jgi:FkbM family methyltransferase